MIGYLVPLLLSIGLWCIAAAIRSLDAAIAYEREIEKITHYDLS